MKTRESISAHKIAILATGDEISNGDILNSNAQKIAQRLSDLGMHVGMHAVAPDNINNIESCIAFLMKSHQALIITGGLGPTSDDLTRFALSKFLDKPLVFHETSWEAIVIRLQRFGYQTPPESNRQQALFPEDANIISNPNGTAGGCWITHQNQLIFMLPGPPSECLPMIDNIVVPQLIEKQFQHISYRKNWMLFGVSEGQIAETLDEIAKPFDCMTGYRIDYPYIEFKIYSDYQKDFDTLLPLIETAIKPFLISEGRQTASDTLKNYLLMHPNKIQICDQATGGLLQTVLQTPQTMHSVIFTHEKDFSSDYPSFALSGLKEYWQQQKDSLETQLVLRFHHNDQHKEISINAPNRGDRVKRYAVEWVCYQIGCLL